MVLVLQRPERHGSLEGGELETCSEDAEGIYFGLDPFQWFPFTLRVTGTTSQYPQAPVGSGPAAL